MGQSSADLGKTLQSLFTLALAQRVANLAGEMVSLGMEANQTEDRFRALTSSMGDYDTVMKGLRTATLGVVDDMHLQQGAMLLVQTAGIETSDELERMMNLITLLKKPSEDMTTAIQNFGLMLANNSILRLDSFGISASKVRDRIEELREELGVDRSEAFRMAVMEEGEKNIAKFGDAADAAGTAVGRLKTAVDNAFQDIAQKTAQGAEGFALMFEFLLGMTPAQQARAEEAMTSVATDFQDILNEVWLTTGLGQDPVFVSHFVKRAIEVAAQDPGLVADMERFRDTIFDRMVSTGDVPTWLDVRVSNPDLFSDMAQQVAQLQAAREAERTTAADTLAVQQEMADTDARRNELLQQGSEYANDQWRMMQRAMDTNIRMNEMEEAALHRRNVIIETIMAGMGTQGEAIRRAMFGMQGDDGSFTMPEFITEEQNAEIQRAAENARMLADNMAEMAENEEGLFTEEEVEAANRYATSLEELATDAEAAAEAFENISLSEMFGQKDAGTLAEEIDLVVEAFKRMGATEAEIANMQRSLDLRSGEQTWSALAFADQISAQAAIIFQQRGGDAAFDFIEAFDNTMKSATLMGIDVNAPEFVTSLTDTFDTAFDPARYDLAGFLQPFSPAQENVSSIETSMGTIADDSANLKEPITAWAENMVTISADSQATARAISDTKTELEAMSQKVYPLQIQPEFVNIPALVMMLIPGLVQWIQGSGGVPGGSDSRASSSRTVMPVPPG